MLALRAKTEREVGSLRTRIPRKVACNLWGLASRGPSHTYSKFLVLFVEDPPGKRLRMRQVYQKTNPALPMPCRFEANFR
uniref:Uncharacterized protein n=1 Tax=Candidatus Kentrum sp. LPFa TaxID=2126335 RepID=A0A450WY46_9GAMM|nr:MAG: hypothetical protein BECKLPF1236A_GA0070988_103262 [Candidatus Kentron sp. LPFa]VFK35068.1 MAG: hypothetical protein BECKLPF1236C_GA0070990_103292 [Candidatus Kentron sp. LPFa]